nr:HI0074 family nucleotidyltransferase substrate-binding subunit [uncultured Butyricicoccus sp.]
MKPHKTKRENFVRAVQRLEEAVQDYHQYHMESIRDGMIQRFEFCFELAWKSLKEYMTEQGVSDLQFPKQVLQEAYAAGLIDDQAIWLEMLRSRNSMSHIYDDELATRIAQRIDAVFLPVLQTLAQTFQS